MVHSFQLEMLLTNYEYHEYKKNLHENAFRWNPHKPYPLKGYGKTTYIDYFSFHNKMPLDIIIKKIITDYTTIYKLSFTVYPMGIIYNNFIDVSDIGTAYRALDKIDELLHNINHHFKLEYFNVSRIDYSFDVKFDSKTQVEHNINLAQRGEIPKCFQKNASYLASLYLKSGNVNINIYDKEQQILDTWSATKDKSSGSRGAYGIVRYEIQCFNNKIENIKRKFGIMDNNVYSFLDETISRYYLTYYISRICFWGDYYTYNIAKDKIENSSYQINTKKRMIYLLETVLKRKGFNNAMKCFKPNELNALKKKYDEINVNPVTIPINWMVDCIQNPLKIIINNDK